jgi:sugar/nucleoside kinase (ribokinase family)
MDKTIDCVVVGSCVVDVLARPVPLDVPIGRGTLVECEPLGLMTGGIVSNAGITMARLGLQVAALTYVGNDPWADVVRSRFAAEGIDTSAMVVNTERATSTSAVLIDETGERSFAHYAGAPRLLDKPALLDRLELFARSRAMLIGYYPLMTRLQDDLAEVLAEIRATGCRTALDAAGDGGTMDPLTRILPYVDYYVPSLAEAQHQTGRDDPRAIINVYRQAGATGCIGVKLGKRGALLSPANGELIEIAPVTPPGPVVDTTGAGDCFYGGLLAGILHGYDMHQAGRLAAAAGACCVTGLGATSAVRDFEATARLAGLQV